jgi:hypothetical protein
MVHAVAGGAADIIPRMDIGCRIVWGMRAGMAGGADLIIFPCANFGGVSDIADSRIVQMFVRIRVAVDAARRRIPHSLFIR